MKKLTELQEQAKELRRSGKTINEIRKKLNISKGSASVWTKGIELTPEQLEEINKKNPNNSSYLGTKVGPILISERARNKRLKFQEKGKKEAKKFNQHLAGCMLYWAEGSKNKNAIIFTNYDSKMIKFFVDFLKNFYQIPDSKIQVRITIYNEAKKIESEKFWLKLLDLPQDSLKKTLICSSKPKKKKNRYEYGGCSVRVNDTEIVQRLFGAIKEYVGINDDLLWLN